jgi:hypothetical protein
VSQLRLEPSTSGPLGHASIKRGTVKGLSSEREVSFGSISSLQKNSDTKWNNNPTCEVPYAYVHQDGNKPALSRTRKNLPQEMQVAHIGMKAGDDRQFLHLKSRTVQNAAVTFRM